MCNYYSQIHYSNFNFFTLYFKKTNQTGQLDRKSGVLGGEILNKVNQVNQINLVHK
jgi:hypothetical protein